MDVPDGATRDEVVAAYRQACARSDEIMAACPSLSTMAKIANPGEDKAVSLRRIVVHMIEETARHAGHADILREQIDGATGLRPLAPDSDAASHPRRQPRGGRNGHRPSRSWVTHRAGSHPG